MFTIESFVQNNRTGYDRAGMPTVAQTLLNESDITGGAHWDPGLLRPYLDDRGQIWVDVTTNIRPKKDKDGNLVMNARGIIDYERVTQPQRVVERLSKGLPVLNVNNATILRKDEWIKLDAVVLRAVRKRMRAWADLRAANTYGGFDGMATPILEHEIVSDAGQAHVDMEGLSEGTNFQPEFGLQGLPLPITHCDFWISERFLAASRQKGQPADTLRAEIAGRNVGETIEKTLIGITTGLQYGTSTDYLTTSKVYGYTTHPDRITKTNLTSSATLNTNITTGGTGGTTFVNEVLSMLALAAAQNFFGPFILYTSTAYDDLLDNDYKANSDLTIRDRVKEIDRITDVRRLDFLVGDVLILVQMDEEVAQAVNGLEVTTVQWETKGGMQRNFKVMGIQVPRIRSVFKSGTKVTTTGIVHATTS